MASRCQNRDMSAHVWEDQTRTLKEVIVARHHRFAVYQHAVAFSIVVITILAPRNLPAQTTSNAVIDWTKLSDDYFRPLLENQRVAAASVVIIQDQRVVFSRTYGPGIGICTLWCDEFEICP